MIFFLSVFLTSHGHVFGVVIFLERNVSPCHHTFEGAAGDQADVAQGELAGGGGGHQKVLKIINLKQFVASYETCFRKYSKAE